MGCQPVAAVQYTFTRNHTQNDTKQTLHRTTQNLRIQKFGVVQAVPRLGELYPGIRHITEEKARKNLSQGSRKIRIHKPNNKNNPTKYYSFQNRRISAGGFQDHICVAEEF